MTECKYLDDCEIITSKEFYHYRCLEHFNQYDSMDIIYHLRLGTGCTEENKR